MKLLAVIAILSVVAYHASAAIIPPEAMYDGPIQTEDGKTIGLKDVDTNAGLASSTETAPIRHRRLTCDVLSLGTKWGSPSKIACPIRCLAQGRKGGSCRDGVCVCRN